MDSPDEFALQTVMQYLHDHGHTVALHALEADSGRRYDAEAADLQGSQLLQWCYRHFEEQAAALAGSGGSDAAEARRVEEHLLRTAAPDFPAVLASAVEGLHPANICAVACCPHSGVMVTGSADGMVRTFTCGGELAASGAVEGGSGVLCLDCLEIRDLQQQRRRQGRGPGLLAAGCMDGSVSVLDLETNGIVGSCKPHRKYVVAARWVSGTSGKYLITCSWDHTFAVLRVGRAPAEGGGGCHLTPVHVESCAGQVEDVCVLSAEGQVAHFLVAVRGSNYLAEYALCGQAAGGGGAAAGAGGCDGAHTPPPVRLHARHNMNSLLDDHVSFSAMRLALSPCASLLLVSADSGRLLVYSLGGSAAPARQVRVFFLQTEPFHHHRAAWHRSGCYVMAAGARGVVTVFEVASCRAVARLEAHAKGVRDLCYDAGSNRLVTCSYDRTVKVWAAAREAAAE